MSRSNLRLIPGGKPPRDSRAASALLSHYVGRSVHVLRAYAGYMDAERDRGILHSAGLDARVSLGVGGEALFVLLVPVEEAVAAELAFEQAARRASDRAPLVIQRQPAPAMPDGGDAVELASRRPVRRVPPAETSWEALRRLLNARCNQLERRTGELASETRHDAAEFASSNRVVRGVGGAVRSSKQLTTDELADAVSWVEDKLYRAGFDFEQDQEAYEERCRQRESLELREAA